MSPRRTGPLLWPGPSRRVQRQRPRPRGSRRAGSPLQHHRYELAVAADETEVTSAELWAAGAVGVWERPGSVVAWFTRRTGAVPPGGTWQVEPDRDWQAEWKATIAPVPAGRFTVVPSWLAATYEATDDEVPLIVDPGRAFGSGHHATTVLCLQLLGALDLTGRTVADVGCGTGVLAIAAARVGATVTAVDIDPVAIEVTRANAAANGVQIDARVGSVDVLDPHDVVVANLVTDVIASLAGRLVGTAREALIVSGITVERQDRALTPLRTAGLRPAEVRDRDGWLAVYGTPTVPAPRLTDRADRLADDPGDRLAHRRGGRLADDPRDGLADDLPGPRT